MRCIPVLLSRAFSVILFIETQSLRPSAYIEVLEFRIYWFSGHGLNQDSSKKLIENSYCDDCLVSQSDWILKRGISRAFQTKTMIQTKVSKGLYFNNKVQNYELV